jgi:heme/copper-type cytochrome/quinol oxidase subunit 2
MFFYLVGLYASGWLTAVVTILVMVAYLSLSIAVAEYAEMNGQLWVVYFFVSIIFTPLVGILVYFYFLFEEDDE